MAGAANQPERDPAEVAPATPSAPSDPTAPEPPVPPAPVEPMPRGPGNRKAALLVSLVLALYGCLELSRERGLAYDEAMHVGLPAQQVAVALRASRPAEAADALLDCDRYPPAYPALLGAIQVATGPSDLVMRRTTRAVWGLALFGIFLLASETVRRRAPRRGKRLAPWMALILAATSPLGVAYSGTLFLEVPFACAMVFALHAWLRRDGSARAEHRAGALVTLAFFTKFNYGALLGLVLLVDLVVDGLRARDRGQGGRYLVRCLHLATLPALAGTLWFGLLRGPEHRRAFVDFMTENTGMLTSAAQRWIDWSTHLAYSPLVLFLIALGFLADLVPSVALARAPARVARLVVLIFLPALALHPFHLDRFLLPAGVGLWVTGGLGLARLAPESRTTRMALGLLLAGIVFVTAPVLDLAAVKLAGMWPEQAELREREYVRDRLRARRSLSPGRSLPVAALFTVERDALLDRVANEVGPDERVGWLGGWSELSRGVLHAGLLERAPPGGRAAAVERFLTEAEEPWLLEVEQADPELAPEALRAWAEGLDAVLFTQPVDMKDRPGRRFVQRYVEQLRADPHWDARRLGGVHVRTGDDPFGPGVDVSLFVLRRIR